MASHTEKLLHKNFPFEPTGAQKQLMHSLAAFMDAATSYKCFLLKGYAGTGKTTLIKSLIKTLRKLDYDVKLLAPTGRAAKVMAGYSEKQAYTIHKRIYFPKKNKTTNTTKISAYIIDSSKL